ncbi:BA75_00890T0 [Komagataella pastoris]|uniref:BA75_00890T0 n=1 Tax=Komagataella pastoris TaxID=4922 RepID=A0A1B2J7N6_PICPA|nr:BA75_00890T0 [Komagataella pastoris]
MVLSPITVLLTLAAFIGIALIACLVLRVLEILRSKQARKEAYDEDANDPRPLYINSREIELVNQDPQVAPLQHAGMKIPDQAYCPDPCRGIDIPEYFSSSRTLVKSEDMDRV